MKKKGMSLLAGALGALLFLCSQTPDRKLSAEESGGCSQDLIFINEKYH